jgi:isoleucyl-tRNA synthetase
VRKHEHEMLVEMNIKRVELLAPDASLVSYRLKPNLPRIGKRYGKLVPAIRKALAEADGAAIARAVAEGREFEIDANGQRLRFEAEDVLVETESAEGFACAEEGGFLVGLDTTLTPELEREGLARELVRTVQEARKQAGLEVSDRIVLGVGGSPAVAAALDAHRAFLMDETLSTRWLEVNDAGWDGGDAYSAEHGLGDERWQIRLRRATQGC